MTAAELSAARLLSEGREAAQAGQRARARTLLLAATDVEPECQEAWWWLATVARSQGQAVRSLETLLKLNPDHARARASLDALAQRGANGASSDPLDPEMMHMDLSATQVIAVGVELSTWKQRIAAVEGALERTGRTDLHLPIDRVKGLLRDVEQRRIDRRKAFDRISRVLIEVKSCVIDRSRTFEPALLAELDAPVTRGTDAGGGGAPGTGGHASGWASEALELLRGGSEAQLDSLVAAVPVSASRAGQAPAGGHGRADGAEDDLGTLREPLSSVRGEERAAARVFMKGELQPGLVPDLIQFFAQNRETGMLCIESADTSALVYFRDGALTDAVCDGLEEEAFLRAAMLEQGRFSYQRGVQSKDVRIHTTVQSLVLETLRRMDEARR